MHWTAKLKSTMLVLLGASKAPLTAAEAAELRRTKRKADGPERIIVLTNPLPTPQPPTGPTTGTGSQTEDEPSRASR